MISITRTVCRFMVFCSVCLPMALPAAIVQIEFAIPNLTTSYNGVSGTVVGSHSIFLTIDTTTPDLTPLSEYGAFATLSAWIDAPGLGLENVEIINPSYLFTNRGGQQLALRWNSPTIFQGQISPINLPAGFIGDNHDLSTLDIGYEGVVTTGGGQWRTDFAALNLATGDSFDAGWDRSWNGGTTRITSIPEFKTTAFIFLAAVGFARHSHRRFRAKA